MNSIALPKKIDYQPGKNPNSGSIIIQPCFPGYGTTIGNSVRRILLSSLPGAAVVGVKIEGADHEFMALPHLKEDILEFILNLKKIRLKIFSDEVVKLNLQIHGKKEIKAGDIEKNSMVEIANPKLTIGHITDMAGNLSAEIFVSQGMGYEMIESREVKEKLIGYIDIDSIFSPVESVGIRIENVRVGKITNWDKIILDITTDGTILPEAAFEKAVNILIGQYQALINKNNSTDDK
ncbi:MAG: DNA-directed RNA polymerase subunit alpha, partial [Patescibacteria group bacterium]|nr:DNA-directed RNA polymerase subunit alpha [Patescibacteria group bacterium]